MAEYPKPHLPRPVERRGFLKAMLAVPGLVSGFCLNRTALLPRNALPSWTFQAPGSKESSAGPITSNADFFVRNHFRTPQTAADSWNLQVDGLVSSPLKLSYSDILLMSSERRPLTMECAGNLSGGIGVGNAVWSGLRLEELLKQAAPASGATTVVLHGADTGDGEGVPPNTHFARAIPLQKATDGSTLLAYEMNGSPLPPEHGFPLRALVAGWYGMDSVKWLARIELLDHPFQGYFQQKLYLANSSHHDPRPVTRMLVNSKFLRPSDNEEIHGKTYRIEGVAWAGEQKIMKVELRMSPDEKWRTVTLATPAAPMTWIRWTHDWPVPGPGKYTLEVRATDDAGQLQPDSRDPDRQDAYELNTPHRISVTVKS